ncbi:MAG: nucleotide exchange factor GrpE, partial [Oscillospiraceae bacterium]
VYDNLERAIKQETADEAYSRGVEMIMTQLKEIFSNLGISEIAANPGDTFDPLVHNAVMHIENEALGENVIAEEFQKGFMLGDKVIRFSVVTVAN